MPASTPLITSTVRLGSQGMWGRTGIPLMIFTWRSAFAVRTLRASTVMAFVWGFPCLTRRQVCQEHGKATPAYFCAAVRLRNGSVCDSQWMRRCCNYGVCTRSTSLRFRSRAALGPTNHHRGETIHVVNIGDARRVSFHPHPHRSAGRGALSGPA